MARSSNKVADGLLASAHDSAVHDGLRLAVPRYLEAVDALVAEGRRPDASVVLAELLAAKEKKRSFFQIKRKENPLGDTRPDVARKYAKLTRGTAPTEESLDVLNQIALEYPDDSQIRIANAEALRRAGYLLDALDEFKYCKTLAPEDPEVDVQIGELNVQLGRADRVAAAQKVAEPIEPEPLPKPNAAVAPLVSAAPPPAPVAPPPASVAAPPAPVASSPASAVPPMVEPESVPAAAPEPTSPVRRSPTAGGLSAFAKRKAMELFANSEYAAASAQLERVVKMSPDVESLEMLLECYLALDRHDEAARIGVQLADAEVAAGNRPGAIATLTTLSKKIADPTVEQRRVDLMKNA
jgi:Flp pilus assembly protein TadD